jgi:hypothetical protein
VIYSRFTPYKRFRPDNVRMRSRRFVLLATILVTLNVVLWLAAPGLALRKAIIQQLFGPKLVRAEVILKGGADWHLDRGVIVSVSGSQLILREADGRVQPIPLSSATRVIYFGRSLPLSALGKRWRVLVTWPASGAALSVDVEHATKGHANGLAPSAAPALHLS